MKARRKKRPAPRYKPLAEVIARDGQNKRALNRQFGSFYNQMKKAIKFNSKLKNLEVPLQRVAEAVKHAAWGDVFGTPMVKVTKTKH